MDKADDARGRHVVHHEAIGVLMDVGQNGTIGSNGEYYWSGAASTSSRVDPSEQFIGIQLTQFQPMSNFPNAEDFKVAACQAIVD